MKDIIKKLKKQGITVKGELHEFWFEHEEECTAAINHYGNPLAQKTVCILRWKTPLGQPLRQAVLNFIEARQTKHNQFMKEHWRENLTKEEYLCHIDFNELAFNYNGKICPFNAALDQITSRAGQHQGWADLRGINLDNIRFSNSTIANACFAYASLKNSKFQCVQLENINFADCNFEQSHLTCLTGKFSLSDANLALCGINAIKLTANFFGRNPRITKISYMNLLSRFFHSPKKKLETEFSCNEITMSGSVEERSALEYAYWYENTTRMIENSRFGKGKGKLFLSCLFTKNWSSIPVVLLWDLIFIIFFAACYYALPNEFIEIKGELLKSVYLSVVTFTTLGYGDITPKGSLGMLLVTLEVITGYVFLGISVILVGRQIKV